MRMKWVITESYPPIRFSTIGPYSTVYLNPVEFINEFVALLVILLLILDQVPRLDVLPLAL